VELILEHGYGKVTVELLMERADLARATFYAHYDSLEELLGEVVGDLIDDLLAVARGATPTGPDAVARGAAISILCTHAQEHRDLYRVILSGAGNGSGRAAYVGALAQAAGEVFSQLIRNNAASERIAVEVVAHCWAGSFASLLDWWLFDNPDRSTEDVTAMATALLVGGAVWGMGVEGRVSLSTEVIERLPL
jgi:AcrR family transcriptional regulator